MTVLDLRRRRSDERSACSNSLERISGAGPACPMPQLDHEQLTRCVQNLKERERTVVVMTFL